MELLNHHPHSLQTGVKWCCDRSPPHHPESTKSWWWQQRKRSDTFTNSTNHLSLRATEVTLKTAFSACLTFFIDTYQYNQHSLKTVSRLSQLFESTPNLEYQKQPKGDRLARREYVRQSKELFLQKINEINIWNKMRARNHNTQEKISVLLYFPLNLCI